MPTKISPTKTEVVVMADHRQFLTTDDWETAVLVERSGRRRKLAGAELDFARFLAVSQSSWAGDAS